MFNSFLVTAEGTVRTVSSVESKEVRVEGAVAGAELGDNSCIGSAEF